MCWSRVCPVLSRYGDCERGMRIHVIHYNDKDTGDVQDIHYQCSAVCMRDELAQPLGFWDRTSGGWSGGTETNWDTFCSNCGVLLWKGLESDT